MLGKLDHMIASNNPNSNENMLHGSSSQYVSFHSSKCWSRLLLYCGRQCFFTRAFHYSSESKHPVYSPVQASIKKANATAAKAEEEAAEAKLAAEDEKRSLMSKNFASESQAAPRSAN